MPTNLLVTDSGGQEYLKAQPSHPMIVKLVCKDEQENFQKTKNASLSGSEQLKKLKAQLQSVIQKELDSYETNQGQPLFGDGQQTANKSKAKFIMAKASQCFETVVLDVEGTNVVCLFSTQ